MKCPSKEKILSAAATSPEATRALKEIFPEYFERNIRPGEIYEWGTSNDGGCGLVVACRSEYMFINFGNGRVYISNIPKKSTKSDLNNMLGSLPSARLFNCYDGRLRGPFRLKSWRTKEI